MPACSKERFHVRVSHIETDLQRGFVKPLNIEFISPHFKIYQWYSSTRKYQKLTVESLNTD